MKYKIKYCGVSRKDIGYAGYIHGFPTPQHLTQPQLNNLRNSRAILKQLNELCRDFLPYKYEIYSTI